MSNHEVLSALDRARVNYGNDQCITVFEHAYQKSRQEAVALLNDQALKFPSLFILLPKIDAYNLYPSLNTRNATACNVVKRILHPEEFYDDNLFVSAHESLHPILKWMLQTGGKADGLNDDYERVMDFIASMLLVVYHDKSMLPAVLDLIAKRYKQAHYYHNLVWAYFQVHDPYVLELVAERLLLPEQEDVELACYLLNLDYPRPPVDKQQLYDNFHQWLEENTPYLNFTGESMQFSSRPVFCRVDLERKYLHQVSNSYDHQPVTPSNETERQCLEKFQSLSELEQEVLAAFSHRLYQQDVNEWKAWLGRSVEEQIAVARMNRGEFV